MSESVRAFLRGKTASAMSQTRQGLRVMRAKGPSQVQFWFLALLIGIGAGFAALFLPQGDRRSAGLGLWHREREPAAQLCRDAAVVLDRGDPSGGRADRRADPALLHR